MIGLRSNIIIVMLAFVFCVLQYRLWFKENGVRDWMQTRKKLATQLKINEKLKKRNEVLLFQVSRLQHSQDAVEARARNELGMVKQNETFYQIVK